MRVQLLKKFQHEPAEPSPRRFVRNQYHDRAEEKGVEYQYHPVFSMVASLNTTVSTYRDQTGCFDF